MNSEIFYLYIKKDVMLKRKNLFILKKGSVLKIEIQCDGVRSLFSYNITLSSLITLKSCSLNYVDEFWFLLNNKSLIIIALLEGSFLKEFKEKDINKSKGSFIEKVFNNYFKFVPETMAYIIKETQK